MPEPFGISVRNFFGDVPWQFRQRASPELNLVDVYIGPKLCTRIVETQNEPIRMRDHEFLFANGFFQTAGSLAANVCFWLPIQPIAATHSSNFSAGEK